MKKEYTKEQKEAYAIQERRTRENDALRGPARNRLMKMRARNRARTKVRNAKPKTVQVMPAWEASVGFMETMVFQKHIAPNGHYVTSEAEVEEMWHRWKKIAGTSGTKQAVA